MTDADEADFLELVIANDRVSNWLDVIASSASIDRRKQALLSLREEVISKLSYAEEAKASGAVALLLRLFSRTGEVPIRGDEQVMAAAAQVVTTCNALVAEGGKTSTFSYGPLTIAIKEGMLGDGVGAKVWTVAHILCRELIAHPEVVRGKKVLEIGSGTGVAGIVAAKLHADKVVLTDFECGVLHNLRDCVRLNSSASGHGAAGSMSHTTVVQLKPGCDGEPPYLDDCCTADNQTAVMSSDEWEFDNMEVRLLDWRCSVLPLGEQKHMPHVMAPHPLPQHELGSALPMPGAVPAGQLYDVLIGTDIMYEAPHAALVAAVIARHLKLHGRCLLCCAVRQQDLFAQFQAECIACGLRYRVKHVQPGRDYTGMVVRENDYEGGFVLIAIDHQAAPATDWHRRDFCEPGEPATL